MGTGAAAGGAIGVGIGAMFPMADGGIVTGPTNAMVGEAGPEAVVPLPAQGVKVDLKPLIDKVDELIKVNTTMKNELVNLGVA